MANYGSLEIVTATLNLCKAPWFGLISAYLKTVSCHRYVSSLDITFRSLDQAFTFNDID